MFERFSTEARHAVAVARSEAVKQGTRQIRCEHLLIALAHGRSGPAADALRAAGLDRATLSELTADRRRAEPLDAEALAEIGIDLDQVRRAAEAAFGPGALDHPRRPDGRRRVTMTTDCRKVLELALRQAQRSHDRTLSAGHLLIGIIDQGDNGATRLLDSAGADPAALRADTQRRLTAAA